MVHYLSFNTGRMQLSQHQLLLRNRNSLVGFAYQSHYLEKWLGKFRSFRDRLSRLYKIVQYFFLLTKELKPKLKERMNE